MRQLGPGCVQAMYKPIGSFEPHAVQKLLGLMTVVLVCRCCYNCKGKLRHEATAWCLSDSSVMDVVVGVLWVWMMLMDCTPFVLQYVRHKAFGDCLPCVAIAARVEHRLTHSATPSGVAPCWCITWHACSLKLLLAVQYWACSQAQLQDVVCLPGCFVLHHTRTYIYGPSDLYGIWWLVAAAAVL